MYSIKTCFIFIINCYDSDYWTRKKGQHKKKILYQKTIKIKTKNDGYKSKEKKVIIIHWWKIATP